MQLQQRLSTDNDKVQCLAVTQRREGTFLGVGCDSGKTICFDLQSSEVVWSANCHKKEVYSLAFSNDGLLLASGSRDKTVCLCDSRTGHETKRIESLHKDHVKVGVMVFFFFVVVVSLSLPFLLSFHLSPF